MRAIASEDLLLFRALREALGLALVRLFTAAAPADGAHPGTLLTECLHKFFPDAFIFNAVVWPVAAGEVVVQVAHAIDMFSRARHLR